MTKFEKNELPVDLTPRPGMDDVMVEVEWVNLIREYIKAEGTSHDDTDLLLAYVNQYNPNLNVIDLIQYYNEDGVDRKLVMTNNEVATLAFKMEPCLKAAHEKVIREWVMETGIRFNGKEGDGCELLDPETGKPRMATVLAVYPAKASALVTHRDNSDKRIIYEAGAEKITKFFKEGKPSPNNPRGGKVGFQTTEFTDARMAA